MLLISFFLLYLSTLFPIIATKPSSSQACAACKYQRRKCSKDCPLAPFFPADQPNKFQCAHRLFGVRNMMSILKQVRDESKQDAMTSIIFESNMRARFPVHGCLGIIEQLQNQLQQTVNQLREVRAQIEYFKVHGIEPTYNNADVVDPQSYVQYNDDYDFLANGVSDISFQDGKTVLNPNFGNLEPVGQSSLFVPQEHMKQQELDVSHYDDTPVELIVVGKQPLHDSSPKSIFEGKYISETTDGKNVAASVLSPKKKEASFSCIGEQFQKIATRA